MKPMSPEPTYRIVYDADGREHWRIKHRWYWFWRRAIWVRIGLWWNR